MKSILAYALILCGFGSLSLPLDAQHDEHRSSDHESCAFAGSPEHSPSFNEVPTEIGQEAFAAMAEMRVMLESNPGTDWKRVDLGALREHLVDMNRVLLDAEVQQLDIEGGFEAQVTGRDRTLRAIQNMVPAHAYFMNQQAGLSVSVRSLPDGDSKDGGIVIRVTTDSPEVVDRIRGLGFFGFMVAGDHHRPHHLLIATGSSHHQGSPSGD